MKKLQKTFSLICATLLFALSSTAFASEVQRPVTYIGQTVEDCYTCVIAPDNAVASDAENDYFTTLADLFPNSDNTFTVITDDGTVVTSQITGNNFAGSLEDMLNQMSNYSGGGNAANELSNYTGMGDAAIDFGGPGRSFFNMNVGEPLQLKVVNAHASRSLGVWLSPGLNYDPTNVPGQITSGAFAGEDAGDGADTGTSITVTCPLTTQNLKKYIYWSQHRSSIISKIEFTPGNSTIFLASNMTVIREDILGQDRPRYIPMRKYADKGAFNLQFIDIYESDMFITDQHIIKFVAPKDSTTYINLYFGAVKSPVKELETKVNQAIATGITNVPLKDVVQNVGQLTALKQKLSAR